MDVEGQRLELAYIKRLARLDAELPARLGELDGDRIHSADDLRLDERDLRAL